MRKTRNAASSPVGWTADTGRSTRPIRRVAAIEFQPGLDCYKALCDAVDPDDEFSEMEFKRYLFGDESAVLTNEYLAAFIEGARQFFLEGASKI
jgi:hypothetical protein